MERMILAYELLHFVRTPIGPGNIKAAWPRVWHDREDENAQVSRMIVLDPEIGDYREENIDERDHRLSAQKQNEWERERVLYAEEVDVMNEALAWPGHYLFGRFESRIAITRWASKRARGHQGGDLGIQMVLAEAELIAKGLRRDAILVR